MLRSGEVIDLEKNICAKVEEMRIVRGLSRQSLAYRLGLTHQQVHKYCKGINRISSGRLKAIANILDVDISYFYGDEAPVQCERERLSLEMFKAFNGIKSEEVKESVLQFIRTIR